jgi:hypothetical protein
MVQKYPVREREEHNNMEMFVSNMKILQESFDVDSAYYHSIKKIGE